MAVDRSGDVYKAYWIHKKGQTNPATEGYVGITGSSIRERIRAHSLNASDESDTLPVYNAIRKYRDDIVVDLLCIGTEEVILGLENSLRPEINIGWNVREGGQETVSSIMKEKWQDAEFRESMCEERRQRYATNEEYRQAFQGGAKRFRESEEGLEVMRKNTQRQWDDPVERKKREAANKRAGKSKSDRYSRVGTWLSTRTKHHIWEKADEFYEMFVSNPKITRSELASLTGFTQNEIDNMHRKFKKGWIPLEDIRWVEFYKNGGREAYGK